MDVENYLQTYMKGKDSSKQRRIRRGNVNQRSPVEKQEEDIKELKTSEASLSQVTDEKEVKPVNNQPKTSHVFEF